MSAQYMVVRRRFVGDQPVGQRLGFIASSDNHTARPGTGYKEFDRSEMTESKGPRAGAPDFLGSVNQPEPRSVPLDEQPSMPFASRDVERMSSFLTTGGLVAIHAAGRDRDSIWQAIKRREVYGTTGDRILLWFDLINAAPPVGEAKVAVAPMGSEIVLNGIPRFRVRAVGARKQQPGCPESSLEALGADRLYDLCRGECHHPSDERRRITRIEVVRLRPQVREDEPIGTLIEDPWRIFACPADEGGCAVEFEDPDFSRDGRDTVYYVRAIEEPSLAVNGRNLRCSYDEQGNCVSLEPCHGDDAKTPYQDDCLAEIEERAWSSPIWVDQPNPAVVTP
jgi:hypothetical protein